MKTPEKILVIQTAFLGDVILSTAIAESLHKTFPLAAIHYLVKEGNQEVLDMNRHILKVLRLNKKAGKLNSISSVLEQVKKEKYDWVINIHRFGSSGWITMRSGASVKIGFDKNPLSIFYSKKVKHVIGDGRHEVQRNHELIAEWCGPEPSQPRIFLDDALRRAVDEKLRLKGIQHSDPFYCLFPASVWFTKTLPQEKWGELIAKLGNNLPVLLLGGKGDIAFCEEIKKASTNSRIVNFAGVFSIRESAAVMKKAKMNFCNDSAPVHLASAVNAPVRVFFCSTVPEFGFGPLSENSRVIQTTVSLDCKPCGLHGYRICPEGHFKCALTINAEDALK